MKRKKKGSHNMEWIQLKDVLKFLEGATWVEVSDDGYNMEFSTKIHKYRFELGKYAPIGPFDGHAYLRVINKNNDKELAEFTQSLYHGDLIQLIDRVRNQIRDTSNDDLERDLTELRGFLRGNK
jgi:hypothetical protein